jgi:hypothetical protein
MKGIVGIIFIFALTAFNNVEKENSILLHRFIVQPSSKLIITGKTNINSFQCSSAYCGRDTLVLQEGGPGNRPLFLKGYVGLDASAFNCGLQMMTNDFGKTIKSKEYPSISIDFISFERLPIYGCAEEKFRSHLKISLSGVTRSFEVTCSIEAKSNGQIHLKGGRNFIFSDFNLEPPTHMMGMVKVKETLDVNFHLILELDTNS